MISDERFFAWLDGELDPTDAATVEAAVADDPELQQRAAAHRKLADNLAAAFDPVIAAPLPARLASAARSGEAEVIDLDSRRRAAPSFSRPVQWAALAATLAVGIVVGSMVAPGSSGPIANERGHLVASGELDHALNTRLASVPAKDGTRIGLTFRDQAGDLCRSFTDGGASGLACRRDGDWRILGLFQSGEGNRQEYRMAAGGDRRLAELVDSTISGEPLDAAAERQALDGIR